MKILIIGAGRMGFPLAQRLDEEGHRVVVLDRDPSRVERVRSRLDVMTTVGSGTSLRMLREIEAESVDMVIACSGMDEVNIVACLQARQLGIPRRVARVDSGELLEDLRDSDAEIMGVTEFINPTTETVNRLEHMILTPGTAESAEFGGGRVILRALRVTGDTEITAAPLHQLNALFADEFRIAAVKRDNKLIVPTGAFQVSAGDIIYVVMLGGNLENFLQTFNFKQPKRERIFIAGASPTGIQIASRMEKQIADVILIDPDGRRCNQASEVLSHTSIINGTSTDQSLMEDLKVGGAGYFLALSDNDEANLTSALLARKLGTRETLMLTTNPEHVNLFDDLPINSVISPLLLSVGAILRSVRAGTVLSLFNIAGDRGEATEIRVDDTAPAVGKPLKDLSFPGGAMVAAVYGNDGAHVAGGGTIINAGDQVVIVSTREASQKAISLFAGA